MSLDSSSSNNMLQSETYKEAKKHWPKSGAHILAQFDDESIIVYQAFSKEIANYAEKHKSFKGAPGYKDRMSWIKTNYMWMMYRSGWATKPNQTNILAIRLKRSFFEEILLHSVASSELNGTNPKNSRHKRMQQQNASNKIVRLQWDPDHHPSGAKVPNRRAIQLGLKGYYQLSDQSGILDIQDITPFVKKNKYPFSLYTPQKHQPSSSPSSSSSSSYNNDSINKDGRVDWEELMLVPRERVYPLSEEIMQHIQASDFDFTSDLRSSHSDDNDNDDNDDYANNNNTNCNDDDDDNYGDESGNDNNNNNNSDCIDE